MRRNRNISAGRGERGVVILLVAIVLLGVVSAMAVLAIDLVSFYTARSEAQLAASGAALAGARVMANSGMTSRPADTDLISDATDVLARSVATRVATSNKVGGRNLTAGEVNVSFPNRTAPNFASNPRVMVQVTRNDVPTFFARIWGSAQVTVSATATAEAYNPSGLNLTPGQAPPVAPMCVKPWVLPNINPDDNVSPIFDPATGDIQDPSLVGWADPDSPPNFYSRCTGSGTAADHCIPWDTAHASAQAWRYYPGQQSSFPEPPTSQPLQSCSAGFQPYQRSIAGCVTTPIACNGTVVLDKTDYVLRNTQAADAVNCMTHSQSNEGDTVAISPPNQAFQFRAGDSNPVPGAASKNVLVSDSLVTVPVYNSTNGAAPPNTVQIIGFVQLFLNPNGIAAGSGNPPRIRTTIVNLIGCGTNATGTTPVLGNGASPVAVRLVQ